MNNSSGTYNWSDKTILIVEDDKFNAYIIENFLKVTNVKVVIATTGEKAIEMATTIMPDLILMDMKLPELNGKEATQQIKKILPNVIIIAQTAFVTDVDKNEAFEAGCVDFISKPIRATNLLNSIAKYF